MSVLWKLLVVLAKDSSGQTRMLQRHSAEEWNHFLDFKINSLFIDQTGNMNSFPWKFLPALSRNILCFLSSFVSLPLYSAVSYSKSFSSNFTATKKIKKKTLLCYPGGDGGKKRLNSSKPKENALIPLSCIQQSKPVMDHRQHIHCTLEGNSCALFGLANQKTLQYYPST